ncbi:DNA-methyltransferase [Bacillus solitudinis]|uniref:DNA-methyltransferase n=1 Tax=Bacillus solitudinis TaxID=2014074 RepID=UPI000C243A0C|nr:site-specific DNA-methyltransferase [Bacillus solitudinis]
MIEIFHELNKENIFFKDDEFLLVKEDSLQLLKKMNDESVDMIFADPPYFLSNNGITCSSGKMVSVNKGKWDTLNSLEEIHTFNTSWLKECQRILKKDGTIWISGTFHNIYSIGMALNELRYKILNNITWYKRNASPNLACRYFTHSTETVLWAKKSEKAKHYFNYSLMKEINNGKQMRDVWDIPTTKKSEKKHGKHPTQKPIALLERIILASTTENQLILDPFNGSGTTGIVATKLNRKYIGIDLEEEFLSLTEKRYKDDVQLSIF